MFEWNCVTYVRDQLFLEAPVKRKIIRIESQYFFISMFSSVSDSANSSCTNNEKNLEVLRSSWIDEDLAFLDGRKEVGYVFENSTRNYRIYQYMLFLRCDLRSFLSKEIDKANELISRLNDYICQRLMKSPAGARLN